MTGASLKRRVFLGGTAISAITLAKTALANQGVRTSESFAYEVRRTDVEWRAMLSPPEHAVLREGSTELPKSHPLWNNTAEGIYCCRGCDLMVYESIWKVELDKGWAFFKQSLENAVLMCIDGEPPDSMMQENDRFGALIEAHCRRCGSHLTGIAKLLT